MTSTEDQTRLFLLSPVRPAKEFRKQLWGALVVKPVKPTDKFSSFKKKAPADIVPDIDVKPDLIRRYGEIVRWARHGGTEAVVESLFKAYFSAGKESTDFRAATTAQWYYMTSPEDQLESLCANDEWAADALAFIKKHPKEPLYFVTAMLVVSKLQTAKAQNASVEGGMAGAVPNPTDGTKLVGAGVHGGGSNVRIVAGEFVHPQILAVGYHRVTITLENGPKGFRAWVKGLFKQKKTKVVGVIHDDDDNNNYKLTVSDGMAEGHVNFMGDNSSSSERASSDVDERTVRESSQTSLNSEGNQVGHNVAIISPNVPRPAVKVVEEEG